MEAQASDVSIIFSGEGLSLLNLRSLAELTERIRASGFEIRPLALVRSPLTMPFHCPATHSRWSARVGGVRPLAMPQPMKHLTIPDGQRELTDSLSLVYATGAISTGLCPFSWACRISLEGFVVFLILRWSSFRIPRIKSNGWVRLQNLINRRWPIFDQQN